MATSNTGAPDVSGDVSTTTGNVYLCTHCNESFSSKAKRGNHYTAAHQKSISIPISNTETFTVDRHPSSLKFHCFAAGCQSSFQRGSGLIKHYKAAHLQVGSTKTTTQKKMQQQQQPLWAVQ
jgi:hypothetical protein